MARPMCQSTIKRICPAAGFFVTAHRIERSGPRRGRDPGGRRAAATARHTMHVGLADDVSRQTGRRRGPTCIVLIARWRRRATAHPDRGLSRALRSMRCAVTKKSRAGQIRFIVLSTSAAPFNGQCR